MGFEPTQYKLYFIGLANQRLKPLGNFSIISIKLNCKNYNFYNAGRLLVPNKIPVVKINQANVNGKKTFQPKVIN